MIKNNISFILNKPQLSENIGACARAIKNFDFKKFGKEVAKFYKKQKVKIIFEIGRFLTGNTGIIISKVIYVKKTREKYFIIIDTGMNDMARSAIYESFHEIIPLKSNIKKFNKQVEFVGPICESSDTFGVRSSQR